MKLYLAGPMTGLPSFNFPAFAVAANMLRAAGYEVLCPAEMDLAEGFDPATGNGLRSLGYYMARDLAAIDYCHGVALLQGWEHSAGTAREIAHATLQAKPSRPVHQWLVEARA